MFKREGISLGAVKTEGGMGCDARRDLKGRAGGEGRERGEGGPRIAPVLIGRVSGQLSVG